MWRRIGLPGRADGFAETPSAGGGVVAVGFSWRRPRGAVPVLAVHDIDGSPGFMLYHDSPAALTIQASVPAIADDVVRVVVYERDSGLVVLAATTDGRELPRTTLDGRSPLRPGDLGAKRLTRIAGAGSGFIVSWLYRQVRAAVVGRFASDGAHEPVWYAPEWLVAIQPGALLTETVSRRDVARVRGRIVCRDPETGRVLWTRESELVEVAGAAGRCFVIVDRSERYAEGRARYDELDAALLSGRIDADTYEAESSREISPRAPTIVRWLDAETGRELRSHEVIGEVVSAVASDGATSVIAAGPDGRGELITWHDGASQHTSVPLLVDARWPPEHRAPVIVGHVEGIATWYDAVALHGRRTVELPLELAGFRPRIVDRRLAKANAVLAYGNIYARHRDALWIAEQP